MLEIHAPNTEEEMATMTAFLASLEWLYLTHRYPSATQGRVLRLLTLSGVDPGAWKYVVGRLILIVQSGNGLLERQGEGRKEQAWLRRVIEDIWCYAEEEGIPVGEPILCPMYLASYSYTQKNYLADLQTIYGHPAPHPYKQPWPKSVDLPQNSFTQLEFLPQAVAIMGATAGAIERLIERGVQHDHRD
jgi:hypothetical protein